MLLTGFGNNTRLLLAVPGAIELFSSLLSLSALVVTFTFLEAAAEVPHIFMAVAVTLPAVLPQFTVMDGVFWPETIWASCGTVQLYIQLLLAPEILNTTLLCRWLTLVVPS